VRRAPAEVGGVCKHHAAVELCGVAGRQIVRHDDAGLGGTRRRRRLRTGERAQHALLHVLQIDGALFEVLVGDAADRLDETIHHLVEGGGRVEAFGLDDGGGVVDEGDVGQDQQVRVEDTRVIVAHARRDVVLERAQIIAGGLERALEARNFLFGARSIDGGARNRDAVGVAHERGADYDSR
jgi:hypothetical protein